jgi:hypothetical protein
MADDALVRAQASESLALQMAMAAGNVNISGVQADTLDLSSNAQAAQERHAFVLAQLEAKRRARSVVLPTADGDVKSMLRTRGYPICLFGEKPEDRRVRLRKIVVHAVVMLGESEDAVATAAAATDSGSSSVATSSSSSRTKAQLEDAVRGGRGGGGGGWRGDDFADGVSHCPTIPFTLPHDTVQVAPQCRSN